MTTTTNRLPPLVIQGLSVRDYAYQWIKDGCPLHQWCSGARGIDKLLLQYVAALWIDRRIQRNRAYGVREDEHGLWMLLTYLSNNYGHPAEPYIPDEHCD